MRAHRGAFSGSSEMRLTYWPNHPNTSALVAEACHSDHGSPVFHRHPHIFSFLLSLLAHGTPPPLKKDATLPPPKLTRISLNHQRRRAPRPCSQSTSKGTSPSEATLATQRDCGSQRPFIEVCNSKFRYPTSPDHLNHVPISNYPHTPSLCAKTISS